MNVFSAEKINQLAQRFMDKKYMLNMGSGKLARTLNATRDEVVAAKVIARNQIQMTKSYVVNYTGKTNFPKILVVDIEVAPLKAYVWRRWKQNIGLEQTLSEWFMLSWAAKWLMSADIMSDRLTGEEAVDENDKRIVGSIWKLLDEADIIIAHNGVRYDVPQMNARFLVNDMHPTTPYKIIDTFLVARNQFGFSSNKLDALAMYFGLEMKYKTGFELWARCMNGEEDALEHMEVYNKHDVELLEEVYLELRPWIKGHPNVGIYMDNEKTICSCCGSENIALIPNKFYYTQTTKYPIYRCKECTGITRGRRTILPKDMSKTLGTNIPR